MIYDDMAEHFMMFYGDMMRYAWESWDMQVMPEQNPPWRSVAIHGGQAQSLRPALWDSTPGRRWCPDWQLTRAWRLTSPGWDLHPVRSVRYLENMYKKITHWLNESSACCHHCFIMFYHDCLIMYSSFGYQLILSHLVTLCSVYTLHHPARLCRVRVPSDQALIVAKSDGRTC